MIGAFTRFDLGNLFTVRFRALSPLLVVLVTTFIAPSAALGVPAGAVVVSLQAGTLFLGDERGRLDRLYAVLPLRRSSVVIGRYGTLLVQYVVVETVATLLALGAAGARGAHLDGAVLLALHEASFVAVALALAVQLPCFFAVGFTRARPMMYAPVAILAVAAWLAARAGVLDPSALSVASGAGALVVVGLGTVALIISARISVRLYARRPL